MKIMLSCVATHLVETVGLVANPLGVLGLVGDLGEVLFGAVTFDHAIQFGVGRLRHLLDDLVVFLELFALKHDQVRLEVGMRHV